MLKNIVGIIFGLFIFIYPNQSTETSIIKHISLEEVQTFIIKQQKKKNISEYKRFTNLLGFMESTNRYHAVSSSGSYLGRYQFGDLALTDIGMTNIDDDIFLRSSYLQELALYRKLNKNKFYLSKYIYHYEGLTLTNGITVTESGILASAHLLGAYTVKRYLDNNGRIEFYDGNNTALSKYMEEFQGINFNLNKTIKNYIEENYDDPRNI